MATTAYPHGNVLTGNLSFNEPNRAEASEAWGLQGLLCAAIGVSLGLLAGTATAVGAWSMNAAPTSGDSAEVRISAPVSGNAVAQNTWRADAIQAQVSGTVSETAAPAPATREISAAHARTVFPAHHASTKSFVEKAVRSVHMVALTAGTNASAAAPVAVEMAVVSEPAVSDSASKPAQMTTEGDLTVADFDASTGTLETREGRSFTVSLAGNSTSSQNWQDYAGNVHYQCTQTGSCSLTGPGVASSATMI